MEGKVDGDLAGSKSVVVIEGADVKGNIYSPTVTLREGATVNGSIDMTGKEQPAAKAPEKDVSAKEARSEQDSPAVDKDESGNKKSASSKKRSASAA